MRKLSFVVIVLLALAAATSAQTEKCFKYQGGGFDDEIRLSVNGNAVQGELSVGRTNSKMPTRLYRFTGTLSKGVTTLRFAGGKVPTAFPRDGDRLTATLSSSGGDKLMVNLWYGSRKAYSATFVQCE